MELLINHKKKKNGVYNDLLYQLVYETDYNTLSPDIIGQELLKNWHDNEQFKNIYEENKDDIRVCNFDNLYNFFDKYFISNDYDDINNPDNIFIVPFFWHVPKSGGSTVKRLFQTAYEYGNTYHLGNPEQIERAIFEIENRHVNDISKFIASNYIYETEPVLKAYIRKYWYEGITNVKFKIFTCIRDPFKRTLSLFQYLQIAKHEKYYENAGKQFISMTFDDYVNSELLERNWMIRILTNTLPMSNINNENNNHCIKQINIMHLDTSIDLIHKYFKVLILDTLKEDIQSIKNLFHIHSDTKFRIKNEQRLLTDGKYQNKNKGQLEQITKDYTAIYLYIIR